MNGMIPGTDRHPPESANRTRSSGGELNGRGYARLVDDACAGDGFGDAGANVFRANVAFKFGLLHKLSGLLACAAEEQVTAGGMEAVREFADSSEAGGIDGSHVAKAENDNGRERLDVFRDFVELVGGAEEKRAVNAIDDSVVGDVLALKDMDGTVGHVIAGDASDGGGTGDLADVGQGGD